ncbi:MAG: transcription termination factor Rho [Mycobacterium pseudokansasii]|uniref:transcription termination factor Rho n=1 Tax=Mycobacterium pseudokansasii TaxID=2341080 RepID=UPI000559C229|nr:transcription termination factor Rho [Mycobacterium pseudokansasii]MBY0387214.1 transcription termination factor Rho [Mycobacterium pseudokansasii]
MTDTDLITAGESTNADTQSESVTKDTSDVNTRVPGGSLSTMVLPELRALANRAGVKGTSGMRKNELIAAIQEITGRANGASAASTSPQDSDRSDPTVAAAADAAEEVPAEGRSDSGETQRRERRKSSREAGTSAAESGDQAAAGEDATTTDEDAKGRPGQGGDKTDERADKTDEREESDGEQQGSGGQQARGDEDGEGRQGRRGRRFRDRRRRGERSGEGAEAEVREDDVLQPVAGILDVLDNYAFVRTSGYLAGPHDVYVSMNMVRKNGLRRGDAVTGAVRVPREGEAGDKNPRQKFNPLVRLDSVNGGSVEDAKKRPDFSKLTPLYPNQRLRLETTTERLTTRVIDLIMPIGKGQRALIVSPPKAGKTTILQDIANAITKNNPECHLMVVLVDERPEEVTDMTRSVKGEVIASTFDRPPSDHTSVAELAIERAKRLVEQGKDVVVLLDSITRLGRAYNNASPASGRILSGGVDSTALYPPKRFLGAARNIEEGGSLTIIATAMVETGSTGDTVIFEEFKGTGNAELKLDRKISERRVFPAVDVNPSGTRKDELLLSPDEFAIVHKLRRVLSGLDAHQAIDLLMSQLRKTKNNYEFLVQVSKTTPGSMDND